MRHTENILCASVLPRSIEELAELLPLCSHAHMVELRLDLLPPDDLHAARALVHKPCIAAVRTQEEGGLGEQTAEELGTILGAASDAGMEYIDVAWRYADALMPKLGDRRARLVLSHHTRSCDTAEITAVAHGMPARNADVYKLVFPAEQPTDTATALHLCRLFARRGKAHVVHAMGGFGRASRLVCAVRGNAWTYTAPTHATATAAGQITLDEAWSHYLPHTMQGALLLGLLGYPTSHSRGPQLHNALLAQAFPATSIPYLYLAVPTPNAEDFRTTWRHIFHSMSVTLPHKERIVPMLDELSDDVRLSGVCNTAVRRNGGWHGFNTDMAALRTLLQPHSAQLAEGTLVVGTGGTARSAVAVLQQLGVRRITCTGRTAERGEALARRFGIDFAPDEALDRLSFAGIIHATSLGMTPNDEALHPAARLLEPGMTAMDVVYTPAETRFLTAARQRGCTTIAGVDMFVLQAVEQFRLFTGIPVQEHDVRAVWNGIAR